MRLSDVGVTDQAVDVLHGGDVDATGRLLSVAEIQHAFRQLRARNSTELVPVPLTSSRRETATRATGLPHTPSHHPGHDSHASGRLRRDWVTVVAAHSGAGASCVALAVADALSAAGRACRLVEAAQPSRSGLVGAAEAELGLEPTGAWRLGSRRLTTVYRRACDGTPEHWPDPDEPGLTVIDLGLPSPHHVRHLLRDRPRLIVTCRVSVPGVRLAEHLLAELAEAPVVLAAVGGHRWPGEVTASLGPQLRRLRSASRVITVPEDRHLQRTGPTVAPLPRSMAAAGRALLALIETDPDWTSTAARSASRVKGNRS